jgi:hypothetical protein
MIPVLRSLRQEEQEFEASLGYIVRPCLKKQSKTEDMAEMREGVGLLGASLTLLLSVL